MNGLCLRCISYNKDVAKNCPTLNSFMVFLHNHKVQATIVSCRAFKDTEAENQPKTEMEKLAGSLGIKLEGGAK